MKKPNILVIFTGGTIGSATKDGWISPDPATSYLLINRYKKSFGDKVNFVSLSPYTILSENLSGDTLTRLINCLFDNLDTDYDGIIVAHGTDTLQYSAVAAEYCLGLNTIPVVFVSSNYPLENPAANGNINFEAAVEFICTLKDRGVFVSYSDDGETAFIHRADRLLRHSEWDHKVFSLKGEVAEYKGRNIKRLDPVKCPDFMPFGRAKFLNDPGILKITATPFEGYIYDLSGVNAIVFTPYHSGTLNTDSAAFRALCFAAKLKKIPMILTGVSAQSQYESMSVFEEIGITVLADTPEVWATVGMWLQISNKIGQKNI